MSNRFGANETSEKLRLARLWQAFGWLMVAAVVWLSLTPHIPWESTVIGWDKAQHFLAYGALMYWFAMAFRRHWRWPVFLALLGALLEVLQGLGASRVTDAYDVLANLVGVFLGLALARTIAGRALLWVDSALCR